MSAGGMLRLAAFAGALAAGSWAFDGAEYEVEKSHVVITSWDGTNLSADVHIPKPKTSGERFPIVIFGNSWACPEFEYLIESVQLAEQGFLVLEYEARGWPGSQGTVSAAGLNEQKDVTAVIDYAVDRKDWPTNASKIALAGISYGGGLALLGAARDPRVTTAVSMSGWATISQALFHNGSPNLVWGEVLLLSGKILGHLDPIVPAMWKEVMIGNESAFHEFAAVRSVETYMEALKKRPIPLFLSNNMEDRLFEGEDMMNFFESYPGPKKLLLNQGIHATAEIGGLLDIPNNHVWKEAIAWLNHWLRGMPAPAEDPLVDFQLRSDKRLREQFFHWPSERLANLEFTMAPRGWKGHGSLVQPPMASTDATDESITFGRKTGFSAGLPILGEVLQVFVDRRITTHLSFTSRNHGIWYYSKLARTTRICGTPVLSVDFTPSESKFQLVAYMWSVNWLNTGTLISHGTISCWNCTAGQRITRKFQLRALCEDISGGLGLGLDMFSELYQPANTDANLKLTFHYSDAFSLTVPEVLSGASSPQEFAVVV